MKTVPALRDPSPYFLRNILPQLIPADHPIVVHQWAQEAIYHATALARYDGIRRRVWWDRSNQVWHVDEIPSA